MRFSVPSICACRSRKFSFDLRSGYASVTANRLLSAWVSSPCAAWNFWKALRIVQQLGRELDGAGAGARLGDADEHLLLLDRKALHGVDEVRDQIRTPLVLVDDLGPRGLDGLVLLLERVVAAAGERTDRNQSKRQIHARIDVSNAGEQWRVIWAIPALLQEESTRSRRWRRRQHVLSRQKSRLLPAATKALSAKSPQAIFANKQKAPGPFGPGAKMRTFDEGKEVR